MWPYTQVTTEHPYLGIHQVWLAIYTECITIGPCYVVVINHRENIPIFFHYILTHTTVQVTSYLEIGRVYFRHNSLTFCFYIATVVIRVEFNPQD